MKTTFIYALCEPGTRTVRYIGKSDNPKDRLKMHLLRSAKAETYLGRWLRSLAGDLPNLVVLREVPYAEWQQSEQRYIRLARVLGLRITNGTDGGEGGNTHPPGWSPSPEARAKMSASRMGKTPSLEARANMRAASGWIRPTGKDSPSFGRTQTKETRLKRSVAVTGEKNGMFGKHHTLEACAEMSLKRKGVPKGPMSESHKLAVSEGKIAANARKRERDLELEWALAPYTLTD